MKLLLDQGLPRTAAQLLRQAGIDTLHVGEIDYAKADDSDILQRGRDEQRTVILVLTTQHWSDMLAAMRNERVRVVETNDHATLQSLTGCPYMTDAINAMCV